MSVPTLTIIGNLGTDPEIRQTNNGTTVANLFIIANSRRKNQQTGEWETSETWSVGATAFNQLADKCRALAKGVKVIAVGRLRTETFTSSDGQQHSTQKLMLDDIAPSLNAQQEVQVRKNGQQQGAAPQQSQQAQQAAQYGQAPVQDPWSSPSFGEPQF